MSEQTKPQDEQAKTKPGVEELAEKDLDQVSGGVDIASPLLNEKGFTFE
jgi:bacteriocin-like protein